MRASFKQQLIAALVGLCCVPCAWAQGAATYTNPVIAGDYPDPSVIRVGEDYWATATSGTWAPHFPLLHSRDLVNWRVAGYVFQSKPAWAKGDFWAPEITADRGRFFIYYTARRDEGPRKTGTLCVAEATASQPQGPYTDRGPLVCEIKERKNVGSIDALFVRDEEGRPFLVWKADGNDAEPDQPTSIYAQQLTEGGTKLRGRRKEILRNTEPWERHVTEGSFIVRRGGWFYHFYSGNACCGRGCDYALGVARARKLLGPWEKNPANPILAANDEWQCPGHGSIVTTPDGRDFMLYHSYRRRKDTFGVGREALLDEVRWPGEKDGWPSINEGRGPSSVAPAPLGVAETDDEAEFFDGFDTPFLAAGWRWPMPVRQRAEVIMASGGPGGHLLLVPVSNPKGDRLTSAVVARETLSGSYTATALVDTRRMAAGALAGLSAYSWRDWSVGVGFGGGRVFIWRREGKDERTLATLEAPASPSIYLRMTADAGETYRFAFSTDGRAWKDVGGPVEGSYIEGARVALTAGGTPPGAAVLFDWVRITQKANAERGTRNDELKGQSPLSFSSSFHVPHSAFLRWRSR
ncbi:MAG TPA: family 43 glycosylhydrolase [Pyrinomonadaceae bacterium]|nr:family 43 glycosylhydrolase [Pyrinomonadaceae bacterium]